MDQIDSRVVEAGLRIGGAVLALLLGRWLARRARTALSKTLRERAMAPSLIRLLVLLAYYSILLLAAVVGLALLGLPLSTTLVAILIVVVVLGIALQQSISNLAATIVFMLFQPFRVGDLIKAAGVMGTVKEIQLLSTVLVTADNLVITIPNGKIQGDVLINYSTLESLRTETIFSVSYQVDVETVKRVVGDVLSSDGRVLPEPAPLVFVNRLGEDGMEFSVRAWVKTGDYWTFQWDLPGLLKQRFETEGIAFAHPQRQVRMLPETGSEAPQAG